MARLVGRRRKGAGMALEDKKTLVVGEMHFFTADEHTKPPTVTAYKQDSTPGKTTALAGWENLGHTQMENPLKITVSGGEVTVKGSLQKHALRTATSDRNFAIEVSLHQFDKNTIKKWMGKNAVEDTGLVYAKPKPQPWRVALLGICEDEGNVFMIHAGSVDIAPNGDFDVQNTEDLVALPVKLTVLTDKEGKTLGMSEVTPLS
jgi:hypothetical protein